MGTREPHPIQAWRERSGLSKTALAAKAGLSLAGLSRIEGGEINASAVVILRLAAACGGEVSEFDIFRWQFALKTGVVPACRVPATLNYRWAWVDCQVERTDQH